MNFSHLPLLAITGLGRGENPQPGAAVLASLRRRWPDARVTGLAYDALESGLYAPDCPEAAFTLPYPSCGTEAYLARLDEIRAEFPFEVLIPTLDAEIQPLLSLQSDLARRGVLLMLPEENAFRSRHKQNLPQLADVAGVNVPQTHVMHCADQVEALAAAMGPVMVKGPYYEATRANHPTRARALAAHLLAEWGGPVLVQKIIEGPEFNFLAVGDGVGGLLGGCALRKVVISTLGKGYAGITVCDPALQQAAEALLGALQWRGPLEFEFIRDQEGVFYLIEINPRFPAWADFPAAVGCNLAVAALEQLLEWPATPLPAVPAGKMFLRHSQDIVCDSAEFARLATEGRIVRTIQPLPPS
jgi:carbamoyl-phosphate synthase large subunit